MDNKYIKIDETFNIVAHVKHPQFKINLLKDLDSIQYSLIKDLDAGYFTGLCNIMTYKFMLTNKYLLQAFVKQFKDNFTYDKSKLDKYIHKQYYFATEPREPAMQVRYDYIQYLIDNIDTLLPQFIIIK